MSQTVAEVIVETLEADISKATAPAEPAFAVHRAREPRLLARCRGDRLPRAPGREGDRAMLVGRAGDVWDLVTEDL